MEVLFVFMHKWRQTKMHSYEAITDIKCYVMHIIYHSMNSHTCNSDLHHCAILFVLACFTIVYVLFENQRLRTSLKKYVVYDKQHHFVFIVLLICLVKTC